MNRKATFVILIGLIALVTASVLFYETYRTALGTVGPAGIPAIGGTPMGGPAIVATVSFLSAKGFVTIIHPTPSTTEFVLPPNSVGQITVSYASQSNNLTMFSLTDPVPAGKVDLSTGSIGTDQGLNVTQSSLTWVSIHQLIVNYTITSGESNGLYVLGLPQTILTTIVNVGTQPYTGPLTWLNGKVCE
jgi:hypothetical protein